MHVCHRLEGRSDSATLLTANGGLAQEKARKFRLLASRPHVHYGMVVSTSVRALTADPSTSHVNTKGPLLRSLAVNRHGQASKSLNSQMSYEFHETPTTKVRSVDMPIENGAELTWTQYLCIGGECPVEAQGHLLRSYLTDVDGSPTAVAELLVLFPLLRRSRRLPVGR